jgi:2-polyprenyl-3-methyl-5-hydroxy-6-metoxy-1,4-benzoquinol methylase
MGLRKWWFHASNVAWTPRLYEWQFHNVTVDAAIRAREEAAVFSFLGPLLQPNDRLLEVGPGTGLYTMQLAPRCAEIAAVDGSPDMLRYLTQRLDREGITNVDAQLGRLPHNLGITGQFDGALTVGVLNYVEDLESGLRALAERVRPGGWVIFTVPLRTLEGWAYLFSEVITRRYAWLRSPAEAVATAAAAGLNVQRMASAGVTADGLTLVVSAMATGATGR